MPPLRKSLRRTCKEFLVISNALSPDPITASQLLLTQFTQSETTPREIYARHVVSQTLKSSPPAWYWVGAATGIVRFVNIFGFATAWVSPV